MMHENLCKQNETNEKHKTNQNGMNAMKEENQ